MHVVAFVAEYVNTSAPPDEENEATLGESETVGTGGAGVLGVGVGATAVVPATRTENLRVICEVVPRPTNRNDTVSLDVAEFAPTVIKDRNVPPAQREVAFPM